MCAKAALNIFSVAIARKITERLPQKKSKNTEQMFN